MFYYFTPIQVAIAFLKMRRYNITFISKNGTFKPVIKEKVDIGYEFPCLYLQYDQNPVRHLTFQNLNNIN